MAAVAESPPPHESDVDAADPEVPAARPTWERSVELLGAGPALLVMTGGLLLVARAVSSARETAAGGATQAVYVVGLLLVFAPAAAAVLTPRVRSVTRVVLVLAMALLLQLSRLVLYPTRFMFHDELVHANGLRQLHESGRLFVDNPLLPVAASYPGLELATDAVGDLTGLGPHASAVVVLVAARLVLAVALLLLVWRLTASTRIAAAAVLLYACNPQMLVFGSQFSYQTLALPLAVLAVYLLITHRPGRYAALLPVLAVWAVCATHHLTAVVLVLGLTGWWLLDRVLARGWSDSSRLLGTVAGAGALGIGAGLLVPGTSLLDYLGRRSLLGSATTEPSALWERGVVLAAVLLTFAVLVAALLSARQLVPGRNALIILLLVVALAYPLVPLAHLASATADLGDRVAAFVFFGVAFVVAWWVWQRRWRRRSTVLLVAGTCVVFLGSVLLGGGSLAEQLPGPFRVAADARSIDADDLAAARWLRANAAPGTVVYADRAGGALAAADGRQDTLTRIGSGIDASRLLLDPRFDREDVALIQRAGIRYLVVDRRDASALPRQGFYVENGEAGRDDRTQPVSEEALRKFATVPGVRIVYDNGSVAVYDLEALRAP